MNPIDLFVIWSEIYYSKDEKGYIYKTRYDGSNKISLAKDTFSHPTTMGIDYTIKRIYVIDEVLEQLFSIDYNGNNVKLIYSSNDFIEVQKMDLYNGFIYWKYFRSFYRINSDGGELSQLELPDDFVMPFKIIHPSRQPSASNLCANTNCTHLCLPIRYTDR